MSGTQRRFAWLTRNAGEKFVALLIAFLLWLAVASSPLSEVGFNVPVEFHNVPDGLEVTSDNLPQVQVRVRGSDRLIRQMQPQDIHLVVDLASLAQSAGERTFELSAAQVRVPPDVDVVQVVPSNIRLSFDKRAVRMVEVRPRIVGVISAGMRVSQVMVEPSRLAIAGPQRHVASVEAVLTDTIDASGVVGKQTFTAIPYVQDPLVRLQQASPVRVTVVTEKQLP